jgi:ergothioneine biosynthesis protein EgtB
MITPARSAAPAPSLAASGLAKAYQRVRSRTLHLCRTLRPEDTVAQSMADASPTKWHLAHTTWFFEEFVLSRGADYTMLHPSWRFLFNSYYQSVGPMHCRAARGMITRPDWSEVLAYRARIDELMQERLELGLEPELENVVTLGLHHEQQHQELLLTDIKHLFSRHPDEPAYDPHLPRPDPGTASALLYLPGPEGAIAIGHDGAGFSFDNERPRHTVWLAPYQLAERPVSNAEFREFVLDGAYRTPTLWLSEGWRCIQQNGLRHPLYWADDLQSEFTLGGRRDFDPHAPVCHISYYEADAFARWAQARLPTEAEWEALAAGADPARGHFQESGHLQPRATACTGLRQMLGDVWEWTASAYVGYPGFRVPPGALGEYNGKFMCGQWVLRGGSCVTPREHIRSTYRNFFYPPDRWQFMGLRLARDA